THLGRAARPSALLRILAVLIPLSAVAPAPSAAARTAKFSGSFEAVRSVEWNQPRGVNLIDCHGQHYYAASGEDRTTIKTRQPFRCGLPGAGRAVFWQFGAPPSAHDPLDFGVEGHGVSTRSYTIRSGTTGGWCGTAETNPAPKTDCGTRLPVYETIFSP